MTSMHSFAAWSRWAWNEDIARRLDHRRGDRPFAWIALKSSDLRKLRAITPGTHFVTLSQNLRRLEKMGAADLSFNWSIFFTRPPVVALAHPRYYDTTRLRGTEPFLFRTLIALFSAARSAR